MSVSLIIVIKLETLGSETSRPMSGRTRIKKRSGASRYSNRNSDDSAGPSDGDATVKLLKIEIWYPS